MKVLLHPAFFPSIAAFSVMAQHEVIWEVHDNFQKQTYRNRCYICTDQGKQLMNIPIQHTGGTHGRQKYKDVKIDTSYPWQQQHLKTVQTAYRASPYFEFYEDDLMPIFEKRFDFLLDANLYIIASLCDIIGLDFPVAKTAEYEKEPKHLKDVRYLVNAKGTVNFHQEKYIQVFEERHGFIKNMSVLDLLFNQGPNSMTYLKNQKLSFFDA